MLNIMLIGAPGSGKGTQANFIKEDFGLAHISTGDLLRANIENGTTLGTTAKTFMDKGDLVPDDLVIKMLYEKLNEDDSKNGFMLDGYPRTVEQAKALDKMLTEMSLKLDIIINLKVNDETVIKRLLGRGRTDDNTETITNRLKVFKSQSEPVLEYYNSKIKILNIESEGTAETIYENIKNKIK